MMQQHSRFLTLLSHNLLLASRNRKIRNSKYEVRNKYE